MEDTPSDYGILSHGAESVGVCAISSPENQKPSFPEYRESLP
jgi:hypothetical protein